MPPYDDYWKHKVDQLWKEVEELKRRVEQLEKGAPREKAPDVGLVPVDVKQDSRLLPPAPVIKKSEHEDPVLSVLREKGPMNIIDLNEALKGKGIDEGVRDTLFNRVKPLLKKGEVSYDESTQLFSAG